MGYKNKKELRTPPQASKRPMPRASGASFLEKGDGFIFFQAAKVPPGKNKSVPFFSQAGRWRTWK
jgi:hypothetical protein